MLMGRASFDPAGGDVTAGVPVVVDVLAEGEGAEKEADDDREASGEGPGLITRRESPLPAPAAEGVGDIEPPSTSSNFWIDERMEIDRDLIL
jgi:hypothetical protein